MRTHAQTAYNTWRRHQSIAKATRDAFTHKKFGNEEVFVFNDKSIFIMDTSDPNGIGAVAPNTQSLIAEADKSRPDVNNILQWLQSEVEEMWNAYHKYSAEVNAIIDSIKKRDQQTGWSLEVKI